MAGEANNWKCKDVVVLSHYCLQYVYLLLFIYTYMYIRYISRYIYVCNFKSIYFVRKKYIYSKYVDLTGGKCWTM